MTVAAAPAGAHTLTVTPALHAVVSGAGTDVTAWVTDGSPNETIQFTVSGYGTLSHTTVETDSTGHALNHFTASSSATGLATITAVDLDDGTLGPASCQIAVIKVTLDINPIWWFGNFKPSNYDCVTGLHAQGPSGSYVWTITSGTGKVGWFGSNQGQDVFVESTGQSTPPSRSDVSIRLKWNTYVVTTVTMYVKSPKLVSAGTYDTAYQNSLGLGFKSYIYYTCRDQYDEILPKPIDLNEHFRRDTEVHDDTQEQWDFPPEEPGSGLNPSQFSDQIWYTDPTTPPPPEVPRIPLGTHKVDHWTQELRVGSTVYPYGKLVKTGTFQRWTDHGRS